MKIQYERTANKEKDTANAVRRDVVRRTDKDIEKALDKWYRD